MVRRAERFVLVVAALALGVALAGSATASADVVWLCQPGMTDNPCRDSLESTIYTPEGESRVDNPPLPADPNVDCFYVYPTVSEQQGPNSNKAVEPQERSIAQYQASRFSQTCRVWAPMYRQQTLAALAGGGSADALQLAYSDVAEAWRDYLAHHNDGRGVVLIGHSQGTRMLRQLLRKEIDPNAAERRQLVSAVLLGGNVSVRKGQLTGGDFQHVPGCSRAGQTGCVFAWSTFNETPPSNSRYGRVPDEDTSGFGFPGGPDYEVLCTNPASIAANARTPLSTYLRSEPFPGVLGALLTEMYSGPPPSAPTPWIQPQDHYTAKCEQRDGANVLFLEPIGSARKLNPAPDPTWGLHLADGNIALGDLVPAVQKQAGAWLGATKPLLKLKATYRRGARGCARGNMRLTVAGADRRGLRSVDFRIGGSTLVRDATAPFRTTVRRADLRGRARTRLRVIAQLGDGRKRTLTRVLRSCG
jgi:hypothetical protein